MKKLLIGVLAVACCVAFSAPVFAEIKVGGMISAEQFYWGVSKERVIAGGVPENTVVAAAVRENYNSVEFAMGQPWNRLNMQYISDDKKIGGFIEIRTGGQRGGGNSVNATANPTGEQNFDWELAYIDWHFNPNFYLRVGRQTQTFAIYSPDQQMGHNHNHIVLSGFGNIHGATSRDAVRAYIKFNNMVRMELQALNPDSDGLPTAPGSLGEISAARTGLNGVAAALPALPGVGGGVAATESNRLPRFDLSLPITFGSFSVEPSFTYAQSRYKNVAAGSSTGYDTWGAAVGGKAGFGPFTLSGEYTYGQNLGGNTYVGAGNGAAMTLTTATGVLVTSTRSHHAWMQAQFDFGPFALQGIVGYEKSMNDGSAEQVQSNPNNAAYYDITRMAYGFQMPFMIAKNMKVVPQFWYYDYGNSASVGTRAVDTNYGSEVTAGLFWQLTF